MKQCTTADRLRLIMQERGITQADILRMAKPYCAKYGVNLGRSMLSLYVSGKVEPGQKKLTVLGLALGVSEAWLMGFDVPKNRSNAGVEEDRLSKISRLASQLCSADQDYIIRQMEWLISQKQ